MSTYQSHQFGKAFANSTEIQGYDVFFKGFRVDRDRRKWKKKSKSCQHFNNTILSAKRHQRFSQWGKTIKWGKRYPKQIWLDWLQIIAAMFRKNYFITLQWISRLNLIWTSSKSLESLVLINTALGFGFVWKEKKVSVFIKGRSIDTKLFLGRMGLFRDNNKRYLWCWKRGNS